MFASRALIASRLSPGPYRARPGGELQETFLSGQEVIGMADNIKLKPLKEDPKLVKVLMAVDGYKVKVSEELARLLINKPGIEALQPILSKEMRRKLNRTKFKEYTLEEFSKLLDDKMGRIKRQKEKEKTSE
jgi:hypothetical protein